jgi:hypothetical protein
MELTHRTTWYARRTRPQALAILALTLAVMGGCLLTALSQEELSPEVIKAHGLDLSLYRAIVDRVHEGENYYDAAQSELRSGGYPTRSIFNWRTPLYAWLLGTLPQPHGGQLVLVVLALATVLLAYAAVRKESGIAPAMFTALLLSIAFVPCLLGPFFLLTELCAGTLITLSICAYANDRWGLGVAAGLLALFLRELTLPYCIVALGLAWWQGRRREIAAWLIGLAAYGLYLLLHALEVASRITSVDFAQHSSWIQFGGVPFILKTARMNALLMIAPLWVTALALPLALLGLAGWPGWLGLRVRLAAGAYIAAFAVVGQSFNAYWGLMYSFFVEFGFVQAPAAVRDLFRAIVRPGLARADLNDTGSLKE